MDKKEPSPPNSCPKHPEGPFPLRPDGRCIMPWCTYKKPSAKPVSDAPIDIDEGDFEEPRTHPQSPAPKKSSSSDHWRAPPLTPSKPPHKT